MRSIMIYEGEVTDLRVEDNGTAKIADVSDGYDEGFFVRLHSTGTNHSEFDSIVQDQGSYRITIERLYE